MTLEVEKLSKRHDQTWALRDVALTAHPGRVTGIFGFSGAGKSSLIQILAGKSGYNGGLIRINGTEFSAADSLARPQLVAGDAIENSFFGLFRKNSASAVPVSGETKAKFISDALESGQKCLLLDDPFTGMDRILRELTVKKMRDAVRERNLTMIVALSNFREVFELCDDVVVLDHGDVVQSGTPEEVYLSPATARVAFLSGRCNLIEARRVTSSKNDSPEFVTINGGHHLYTDRADKSRFAPINLNNFLTIRPEHISLYFGAAFPEDNLLKASITGVKFEGASTRVMLDAGGLALEAAVMRLVGLNIGEECIVGLPPDRIQVFKG